MCIFAQLFLPYASNAEDERYSSLVIDASTGAVLHQENAGRLRYPASLTKTMTLYLAFQELESGAITMNTRFKVSAHAATQKPSLIGFRTGQTVTVQDLINAVIIKSANDAAVVLAEGLAGSEWQFSMLMTRTAKSLGMKHTNFSNASGLPDDRQVTTAYDLARLAVALRRDYPQYYPMFSRSSFTYNGRAYFTHNRVTKNYRGADGLKTGYIRASGFNLVTSARRGDKSLVGVVMGGRSIKSRDTTMVKLLDEAFYKMASGGVEGAPILNTSAAKDEVPNNKSSANKSKAFNNDQKIVSAAPAVLVTSQAIVKNTKPSIVTNQRATFSRDVAVVADSNIPYEEPNRDIFTPAGKINSKDEVEASSANVAENSLDDFKSVRVRVHGKRVPLPTLRPEAQKNSFVKISPRGNNQYGMNIATTQQ